MLRVLLLAVAMFVVTNTRSAVAGLTGDVLATVGTNPKKGARVPATLTFTSENDIRLTIGDAIGSHAAVLILADYTCTTICGPVLALAADALRKTRLVAGKDYGLIVVGIDPKDGPEQARAMRSAQLGDDDALVQASRFLSGDATSIERLAKALGYTYAYDQANDQYAHSAAIFVLAPDGRVFRVLTGLGVTFNDLELALIEASAGKIGTWRDQVRLICYGFDPVHGAYSLTIFRVLAVSAGATALALAGGIGALFFLAWRRSNAKTQD